MTDRMILATVLRALADCLERGDNIQVDRLLADTAILKIVSKPESKKPSRSPTDAATSQRAFDLLGLVAELEIATGRDAARAAIKSKGLRKAQLEELARAVSVSVARGDTIERLTDRIVEATVGARLNSAAIRGP